MGAFAEDQSNREESFAILTIEAKNETRAPTAKLTVLIRTKPSLNTAAVEDAQVILGNKQRVPIATTMPSPPQNQLIERAPAV
jgi:hypothetical protein